MMPSPGGTPETCQFTTPPTLPAGTYDLYVAAVGVQSKSPFPFTVGVGGTSDGGTIGTSDAGVDATTGGVSDAGPGEGASPSAAGSSSAGASSSGPSAGGGSTPGAGGGATGGATGAASPNGDASSTTHGSAAGCGCRLTSDLRNERSTGPAGAALFALGMLALRRRSRRGLPGRGLPTPLVGFEARLFHRLRKAGSKLEVVATTHAGDVQIERGECRLLARGLFAVEWRSGWTAEELAVPTVSPRFQSVVPFHGDRLEQLDVVPSSTTRTTRGAHRVPGDPCPVVAPEAADEVASRRSLALATQRH